MTLLVRLASWYLIKQGYFGHCDRDKLCCDCGNADGLRVQRWDEKTMCNTCYNKWDKPHFIKKRTLPPLSGPTGMEQH